MKVYTYVAQNHSFLRFEDVPKCLTKRGFVISDNMFILTIPDYLWVKSIHMQQNAGTSTIKYIQIPIIDFIILKTSQAKSGIKCLT